MWELTGQLTRPRGQTTGWWWKDIFSFYLCKIYIRISENKTLVQFLTSLAGVWPNASKLLFSCPALVRLQLCVFMIEPVLPAEARIPDSSLGTVPTRATSLLLPDWPAECICLSWAFFPFTHSLCRDARQISIIHKQLSYLPQRMTQVCVYWFKINNLHSWHGGTFPGWRRCVWTWKQERFWEYWRWSRMGF